MDLARLDLLDGGADDPFDVAFDHQQFGEHLGVRDVAAARDVGAAHAEVAQFVLVADPDEASPVADAGLAKDMFDVVDVFEGGALAGAGSVSRADDERPAFPLAQGLDGLLKLLVRFQGVRGCADRNGVAGVRPEAFGGAEVQLRAGGVDQIIVGDLVLLARPFRGGVLDRDIRSGVAVAALGMDGDGLGLMKLDPDFLVDFGEVEGDLVFSHLADADPDVGGNEIPFGQRGDDDDLHRPRRLGPPFGQVTRRGVSGNSCAENDDPRGSSVVRG